MQKIKKILIINKKQFGYLTDTYKYCIYNNKKLDITLICFDSGFKKVEVDNVKIIYIKNENFFIKFIKFFCKCITLCYNDNYDKVFMVYFPLISIIKLMINTESILDIRTGSIEKNIFKRTILNLILRFETIFFDKVSIISESLRDYILISKTKTKILPLGFDYFPNLNKKKYPIRLLYIGTFNNRNIAETILGLKMFLNIYPDFEIYYDIVGYGNEKEEKLIIDTIKSSGLSDLITFHGRKNHSECMHLFQVCNVGVSYIPMTKYYDCQPPTKTFEYLGSGMICLATNTSENRKLINNFNGVLFKDNSHEFSNAIKKVVENYNNFNLNFSYVHLNNFTWKKIGVIFYKLIMNNDI